MGFNVKAGDVCVSLIFPNKGSVKRMPESVHSPDCIKCRLENDRRSLPVLRIMFYVFTISIIGLRKQDIKNRGERHPALS